MVRLKQQSGRAAGWADGRAGKRGMAGGLAAGKADKPAAGCGLEAARTGCRPPIRTASRANRPARSLARARPLVRNTTNK